MSKWDNFRERRQKAIDEYIRQVRIKKARHTMIKQIALQKTLKDISEWLKTAKRNRLIKIKGQMMVAWISLQWKKKMKRRGASLEIILRNKFRYVLTGQPLEM
jgi:site-specific recombinase XerD